MKTNIIFCLYNCTVCLHKPPLFSLCRVSCVNTAYCYIENVTNPKADFKRKKLYIYILFYLLNAVGRLNCSSKESNCCAKSVFYPKRCYNLLFNCTEFNKGTENNPMCESSYMIQMHKILVTVYWVVRKALPFLERSWRIRGQIYALGMR